MSNHHPMKRTLILVVLMLSGGLAFAQAPVDYTGIVTKTIDQMTNNFSPLFLAEGQTVFNAFATVMLVILGLKIARKSVSAHTLIVPLDELIHFGFLFVLGKFMLRYWNAPTALLAGYNVHSIIPSIAYALAGKINIAALNTLTGEVDKVLRDANLVPNPLQFFQVILYFEITGWLVIIDAVLFVLTLLGFVAVAIGNLLGPLLVPFILVPRFEWLFYNWISFTIKYSFYQVIANALTFIWANAFVFMMTNIFGGVVTLAQGSTEVLGFVLFTAGMVASIWFVTHWANDLFAGSSHTGSSISGAVKGAVGKGVKGMKKVL